MSFILANIFCALLFSFFAFQSLAYYCRVTEPIEKFASLLRLVQSSLICFFFLTRHRPQTRTRLFDIQNSVFPIIGTFIIFFFLPAPHPFFKLVGFPIQLLGTFFSILSLQSLNRSLAIMPAKRIIKTSGMYQYIRHPLYASYLLYFLGFTIANPSLFNLTVYLILIICDVTRIFGEEKILNKDPEYVRYSLLVKWRIIPFIF